MPYEQFIPVFREQKLEEGTNEHGSEKSQSAFGRKVKINNDIEFYNQRDVMVMCDVLEKVQIAGIALARSIRALTLGFRR